MSEIDIDVKVNPVYLPFLNKHHFMQIFFGGSSSGKSYVICQKIVLDNFVEGANYLICRNVASTIRRSTFNEIRKAISNMGLSEYYKINSTDMLITNVLNGRQIMFVGLDDPEKVKSITPADDVLHRVFVEEATEIKRDAYMQLKKRLRGKAAISKHIIFAFNPILKSHWIYKEFFNGWVDGENYFESDNYGETETRKGYSLCILKTTYKDNIFLTADDKALLENESDPYYYNVYSLGNWGVLGHIIFKNWRVEDLSDKIPHFDKIHCGMDFGYSSDPNALIKSHLDKANKKIYVYDEHYQAGMTDDELVMVSRSFFERKYVTCDSSEPKTIDYLAANGINAIPAVKGADSINRGIRWLQGYEIIVDVRCQNFKNEIEQYHWQEDKYGNAMAKAVDLNNHLLDALRYAYEDEILATEVQVGHRL